MLDDALVTYLGPFNIPASSCSYSGMRCTLHSTPHRIPTPHHRHGSELKLASCSNSVRKFSDKITLSLSTWRKMMSYRPSVSSPLPLVSPRHGRVVHADRYHRLAALLWEVAVHTYSLSRYSSSHHKEPMRFLLQSRHPAVGRYHVRIRRLAVIDAEMRCDLQLGCSSHEVQCQLGQFQPSTTTGKLGPDA
jgi:hypothetical protein